MAAPLMPSISPFFMVADVERSIGFYRDRLGFAVMHQEPAAEPFFAILARDGAMLFVKSDADAPAPMPNAKRHPSMRWDAYLNTPDPDALAADLTGRGAVFT